MSFCRLATVVIFQSRFLYSKDDLSSAPDMVDERDNFITFQWIEAASRGCGALAFTERADFGHLTITSLPQQDIDEDWFIIS